MLQKIKVYELKGLMLFSIRVDVIVLVTSLVSISFLTCVLLILNFLEDIVAG